MKDYLSGAIPCLLRRASLILKQINSTNISSSISHRISDIKQDLNLSITDLNNLINDPILLNPIFSRPILRVYRTLHRTIDDIEALFLPLIEYWGTDQENIQKYVNSICAEANLPGDVKPLTALYSYNYFYVLENVDIIFLPRLEGHFYLHIPDLFHEIGHIIIKRHSQDIFGGFQAVIKSYFNKKLLRAKLENNPSASDGTYIFLNDSWNSNWIYEFGSDIIATFICGPAYGWANYHLCASQMISKSIFDTGIEESSHPADEARWIVISQVLTNLGYLPQERKISKRWRSLVNLLGQYEPSNFRTSYPQELLSGIVSQVIDGLVNLGIKPYSSQTPVKDSLANVLNIAWEQFWKDPERYDAWEAIKLK